MIILRYCFNVACFSIAFGMTVYWMYKFWKDEDGVQISLKHFDTVSAGQYPVLSLCFKELFVESKLKHYNITLTEKKYLEILKGERGYDGMEEIDFDDITINMTDFYLSHFIRFRNETGVVGSNFLNEWLHVTYSFVWSQWFIKCFGFNIEYTNVKYASFGFNSSVFPNKIRPADRTFMAFIHLPNQFPTDTSFSKYSWPKRTNRKALRMSFTLQQVEVLRKRNKRSDPCISDSLKYDEVILEEHLEKVGCRAPHQKTNKNWKICDARLKMKEAAFGARKKSKSPCKTVSSLFFAYHEWSYDDPTKSDWFRVYIAFPSQFKEIKMVRAIDIHSAIGNSGGYIGLFLGNITLSFTYVSDHNFNHIKNKSYLSHSHYLFLLLQDMPYFSCRIFGSICVDC